MSDHEDTPEDRRLRFLRWAAKARESAAKTSATESRNEFLSIAKSWQSMADAIRDNLAKLIGR